MAAVPAWALLANRPVRPLQQLPIGKPPLVTSQGPSVAVGQVALWAVNGLGAVICDLGDATPQPGITPNWQTVERQGRVSLLWWGGRDPEAVSFNVVLDGRLTDASVEGTAHVLEALAGIALDGPPPVLRFDSRAVVPLDRSDPRAAQWRWAITTFDPQDAERLPKTSGLAGHRVFAMWNLVLTRYEADDDLVSRSAAVRRRVDQARRQPAAAKRQPYTTKEGDTLVSIAVHELGDVDRWTEIRDLNPSVRDGRHAFKAGVHLILPPRK